MEILSKVRHCDGQLLRVCHDSIATQSRMTFSVFLPPQLAQNTPCPVLFWLSGLTCTDENFCQKAGAFKKAAELGLIVVVSDTSPRCSDFPGEHERYDIGSGAGFYVNACVAPWRTHYRMYDYIVSELPEFIDQHFLTTGQRGIAGHSMGGHGALVCGLSHPEVFRSISAFAPICKPSVSPWGMNAFRTYLGHDETLWLQYDACHLIRSGVGSGPLLIDQGSEDEFLSTELMPQHLLAACKESGVDINYRLQQGYDHSYYFIASFIDEHLQHHHQALVVEPT